MSNGIIDIRESEFDETASKLNRSNANLNNMSINGKKQFEKLNSTGMLSKTSSLVRKQTNIISNQIKGLEKSLRHTYDNYNILENELYEKVCNIKSPQIFYKYDSSSDITTNHNDLNKDDGKAINANNDNNKKELNFKDVLEYNSKLKSIIKEYEELNGEIDIKTNKDILKNIKKEEVSIASEIENNTIEENILENINKQVNEANPELNDNFKISKIYMKKANNNESKETNYDDEYKMIREEIRKKLNNGNYILVNYKK